MADSKKFGTFEGVFTPTILTILGVIMYLRLGWVVGNAGFGGALLIIMMANVVTVITGLSIASIATNIKIGAGGLYALISRSLGPEVGSAIGIPLYLSQTLSTAMYIVGFTEGFMTIFPEMNPLVISSVILLILFVISFISAKVAMKVQFLILALIGLSLVSFFAGKGEVPHEIITWGSFETADFWIVFAIFFPAVTGIGVGAAMSGDLKDSRKSLPWGILPAVFISMVLYIVLAFWFDYQSNPEALTGNYSIILNLARWPFLVLGGILGATLSSALGSIVGSPRTLLALGQDKVIPFPKFFAQKSKNGEPHFSLIFTAILVEICLLLGDLNSIAPLLTMFFLITYGTLNAAVAIEKSIGIPSFRPSFSMPAIIPVIGALWCFAVMFLINPIFAGISIVLLLAFYIIQVKKGIEAPWGDVRFGMFNAIAEWAVKKSSKMPQHAKSWKPNMVIPIEDPQKWKSAGTLIRDMIYPSGTLRLFSMRIVQDQDALFQLPFMQRKAPADNTNIATSQNELQSRLDDFVAPFKDEGIFTAETAIECSNFLDGMNVVLQTTRGMFFPPNILFLTMSANRAKDDRLEKMIALSRKANLGICVYAQHPKNILGNRKVINVWLRKKSPNRNLALLIALQLKKNWDGFIRLIYVAGNQDEIPTAQRLLSRIADRARLPGDTEISVLMGNFQQILEHCPEADLNIFGMTDDTKGYNMNQLMELSNYSCLFVRDSGEENVLA